MVSPPWKSRGDKELQLRLKLAQLKSETSRYIDQCERLSKQFDSDAINARKIENNELARNFAAKAVRLEVEARRAKSFLLVISDLELSKEQNEIFIGLSQAMRDFVKTVGGGRMDATWLGRMRSDLDRAVSESEKIDGLFGEFMDDVSRETKVGGIVSDSEILRRLSGGKTQKEDKELSDEELDRRIEEGLKKLEQMKE